MFMGLVGKGVGVLAICIVILMLKSSYNTRLILGVVLIAGLIWYKTAKK